jgi:hypothetical protein
MTNGYGHKHDEKKQAKKSGKGETRKSKDRPDKSKAEQGKEQAAQPPKS